jgi:hypothetical protein
MEPLSPVGRDELSTLAMENELLRYEVAHLRARLAAAEAADAAAATVGTPAGGADGDPAGGTGIGSPTATSARDDLVWLLRRLDASPAGPLLRRRPRFRELRERYLGETSR